MATVTSFAPTLPFATPSKSSHINVNSLTPPPNPLTKLPQVDFDFEDLRQRMSDFTVKFDAFIERGRKRVLEERNEFRGRLGELAEDQRLKSQSIATLSSATSTHRSLLAREQSEKDEMNSAIRSLEATHAAHCQSRDRLKLQIAQTQKQIDSKLLAQRDYAAKLEAQSRLNGPELAFWETYLAKIESLEDREVWFDLDLSKRDYEVKEIGGAVEVKGMAKLKKIVDRLNETRDLGQFLARMRALFLEEAKVQ